MVSANQPYTKLKNLLVEKNIKTSAIARDLRCDISLLSAFFNGYGRLPKKYHSRLCSILQISQKELDRVI